MPGAADVWQAKLDPAHFCRRVVTRWRLFVPADWIASSAHMIGRRDIFDMAAHIRTRLFQKRQSAPLTPNRWANRSSMQGTGLSNYQQASVHLVNLREEQRPITGVHEDY